MSSALVWLRRDLRLDDNTALEKACRENDQVHVAFVFDSEILDKLPSNQDTRVTFIHQSVEELNEHLKTRGSCLNVLQGDPGLLIPKLARSLNVDCVVCAHDDDPYAMKRDKAVGEAVRKNGADFQTVKDHVIFERQEIVNSQGQPFKVFTPYRNAWRARLEKHDYSERTPNLAKLVKQQPKPVPTLNDIGFMGATPWIPGGASHAKQRLHRFLEVIDSYEKQRNIPEPIGTSMLSADLRHGTISIRELVRTATELKASKWLSELVWREFYHMILANFPQVATEPFKPEFRPIKWPGDQSHLEIWKRGRTGFPLVDASMRCLNETGWMHNRLRMVTAMFLSKDLLIDYRLGEQWFAEKLLDYDLANNNGGWQWCASTGVDAQPWFRIMNPLLQSQKFDPQGQFIKKWCPELKNLDQAEIHWPHGLLIDKGSYPDPVVDHKVQRGKALSFLESVAGKKR